MIVKCGSRDFETIWAIINDGASAYRGVVSADLIRDPYILQEELHHEIDTGIEFWGYSEAGTLVGVMGLQVVEDVTLIRHAYVRTTWRNHGIGGRLLVHLRGLTHKPMLIGTWADAIWAIRFYEKHGFRLTSAYEKERLLWKYWKVSERQIESSVVLADGRAWKELTTS
jgi:GNAT superfamily N-acetyltransferase